MLLETIHIYNSFTTIVLLALWDFQQTSRSRVRHAEAVMRLKSTQTNYC